MNGLVLLLPHGYEGQGADHSSARLERFLSLCAEYNFQVANCTTPANFFHLLRRQVMRPFRKPLVVMTPKSLLRHPAAVSPLEEMDQGTCFREILDDPTVDPVHVKRVIGCSGKLYYDLADRKAQTQRGDVAILRLEQLYPLPVEQLHELRKKYAGASEWLWVQEEPWNMGAWPFLHLHLTDLPLTCISRKESSTTATGFPKQHAAEQKDILDRAFGAL
jgi:2-oxoglutarate dehydrogenase E1 component